MMASQVITVDFSVWYETKYGEDIVLRYALATGLPHESHATRHIHEGFLDARMSWSKGSQWRGRVAVPLAASQQAVRVTYKYGLISSAAASPVYEWGPPRSLNLCAGAPPHVEVRDLSWHAPSAGHVFEAPRVAATLFRREVTRSPYGGHEMSPAALEPPPPSLPCAMPTTAEWELQEASLGRVSCYFSVQHARVRPDQRVVVVGGCAALGQWRVPAGLFLTSPRFPLWTGAVLVDPRELPCEYKVVLAAEGGGGEVVWETGPNRVLSGPEYVRLGSLATPCLLLTALRSLPHTGVPAALVQAATREVMVGKGLLYDEGEELSLCEGQPGPPPTLSLSSLLSKEVDVRAWVRAPSEGEVLRVREEMAGVEMEKRKVTRMRREAEEARAVIATPLARPLPLSLNVDPATDKDKDNEEGGTGAPDRPELQPETVTQESTPLNGRRHFSGTDLALKISSSPVVVDPMHVESVCPCVTPTPSSGARLAWEHAESRAVSSPTAYTSGGEVRWEGEGEGDDPDPRTADSEEGDGCTALHAQEAPAVGSWAPASGVETVICISESNLRLPGPSGLPWRGGGVSFPLHALRTARDHGMGDFGDLRAFLFWAAEAGLTMVSLSPVNDTHGRGCAQESSPYRPVSAFALHPAYISLADLAADPSLSFPAQLLARIASARERLNTLSQGSGGAGRPAGDTRLKGEGGYVAREETFRAGFDSAAASSRPTLDYEAAVREKTHLLREMYRHVGEAHLAMPAFAAFYASNADWLQPYALYCVLREVMGAPSPSEWGARSKVSTATVQALTDPSSLYYKAVAFVYWQQFIAHSQLSLASITAMDLGVVLAVDVPQGMSSASADAWVRPGLVKGHRRLGSPPDVLAREGAAWAVSPIRWSVHGREGYSWWGRRMDRIGTYFGAVCLGGADTYFRAYELPATAVTGLAGCYSPAVGLSMLDLRACGLWDSKRLCMPYVREWGVRAALGPEFATLAPRFFRIREGGLYEFRDPLTSERSIRDALEGTPYSPLVSALVGLLNNVCLHEMEVEGEGEEGWAVGHAASTPPTTFHPRVDTPSTTSFLELDEGAQGGVRRAREVYAERQGREGGQAGIRRLAGILQQGAGGVLEGRAPQLAVFAQDTFCTQEAAHALARMGVMGTRTHALPMPGDGQGVGLGRPFSDPASYGYGSVAVSSTWDSLPLRAWWESDPALAAHFYHTVVGKAPPPPPMTMGMGPVGMGSDALPRKCTPDIAASLIQLHCASPAMWAVFPLQDLLGMDPALRHPDPYAERAAVRSAELAGSHVWRWRCHVAVEELRGGPGRALTGRVRGMVEDTGRQVPVPRTGNKGLCT